MTHIFYEKKSGFFLKGKIILLSNSQPYVYLTNECTVRLNVHFQQLTYELPR